MISIVMPVCNTGEFLRESVKSLQDQTYSDFELICVDDASTDILTKTLLKKYKKSDHRIKLITLERKVGAAEARNIGMRIACGDYIIFLDADDIFDSLMLEKMYESISENDADICVCGHRNYLNDKKIVNAIIYPEKKENVTDRVFRLSELSEYGLMSWSTAPWNKLCKRSFIDKKKIYFQTLHSSNDVFFSCLCAIYAERIVYCQNGMPLLNYRNNTESQISATRNPIDFFEAISFLLNKMGKERDFLEYKQIICFLILGIISNIGVCNDELKNKKAYDLVKSYLQENADTLSFDDKNLNNMLIYFRREEYDSNWFTLRGDFYLQLKKKEETLFKNLQDKERIVIWGNGRRGKALQRLFKERNMESGLITITDIKNEKLGEKTLYGYIIVSTNLVIDIAEVIIATNRKIYDYVMEKFRETNIKIINLEMYCQFE